MNGHSPPASKKLATAILASVAIAGALAAPMPAAAQNPNAPPSYGSISLPSGFAPDPYQIILQAGGDRQVNKLPPGCTGYINAVAPDVTLDYRAGGWPLNIYAISDSDTTLVIRAPDGRWLCDDDTEGFNPLVSIPTPPTGSYAIWVGTFGNVGRQPARLFISEIEPQWHGGPSLAGPNLNAPPAHGTRQLWPGFQPNPQALQVVAGGTDPAAAADAGCSGSIDFAAPDLVIDYRTGSEQFSLSAESGTDLTLAVHAPDGRWYCNDDTDGLNPRVTFETPLNGRYHVFVGTYGGGTANATLMASHFPRRPAAPDPDASPAHGTRTLAAGFMPDPDSIAVTAGGTDDASLIDGSCYGSIDFAAPDVTVNYTAGRYALSLYAESGTDLVLAVNAPDGRWYCDDDTDGQNPRVTFERPLSGPYAVFVGTYGGGTANATLYTTEFGRRPTTPNLSAVPAHGTRYLSAGFQPHSQSIGVVAGGPDAASIASGGCSGSIDFAAPDVNVTYTAGGYELSLSAESATDLTLAVNAPDGRWYCNDDTDGLNPRVTFPNPLSGTYNVFVGTFGGGTANATVSVSEFGRRPASPNLGASPTYGSRFLSAGFLPDPLAIGLQAGGPDDAGAVAGGCNGSINFTAPDVNISYTAGGTPLSVYAESGSDTTLVVNAPDGRWYCNDDTDGLNPRVTFPNPMSGTYNVWVGTFGGGTASATLYVSERSGGGGTGGFVGGPNLNANPTYGTRYLSAGFQPDPQSIGVQAGGSDAASAVASGCSGSINFAAPDANLIYTAGRYQFGIYAISDSDTTLVVNAPDGRWYCDDDGGDGLNPRIDFASPMSGTYNVWVGTYGGGTAGATLYATEAVGGSGGGQIGGILNARAAPRYGTRYLSAGFIPDPDRSSVQAGGGFAASALGGNCTGYISPDAPDLNVQYTPGSSPLSIYVESGRDTTLVVQQPDGTLLCNDDFRGTDPAVEIRFPMAGTYHVWVGTYASGPTAPATVSVSEYAPF